jgi:hypothetical protein
MGQPALRFPVEPASASAAELRAPSGITAKVDGDAIVVADASGRVVARCTPDTIELVADRRDLVLRAPSGRVKIDAALDVELTAGRDLTTSAGRDLGLTAARSVEVGVASLSMGPQAAPNPGAPGTPSAERAPSDSPSRAARLHLEGDRATVGARRIDVDAEHANVTASVVTTLARRIATRVDSATLEARAYEVAVTSLVTKARDTLTEVADSIETRAGAMRSLVKGLFALHSERTALVSKEDTSVDGKKILLG